MVYSMEVSGVFGVYKDDVWENVLRCRFLGLFMEIL